MGLPDIRHWPRDRLLGAAPVGSPRLLVAVHGGFVADTHRPLFAEPTLARRYRLIGYHRRGYVGSSRTRGPVPLSEQAADCRRIIGHLGIERAHVVGHSLGASIALQLALDAPAIVGSLGLLEPAVFVGTSSASYREAQLRGARRYRDGDPAEVLIDEALRIRRPDYRIRLEEVVPGALEQAIRDAVAVFEMDIGQLDWHFSEADARRIGQPALVVLGSESPALHPRFAETYHTLLQWLPHSEGFVLPEATHFLHVENAERGRRLAEALAGFLARHPI